MIFKGSDLIISDGSQLVASKSCSVELNVETIKVSSPTDGQWEHSIAGRSSWRVTTSHLLQGITPFDGVIEAMAFAHSGASVSPSYVKVNGTKYSVNARGLSILPLYPTAPYATIGLFQTWDTYTGESSVIADMIDYLQYSNVDLMALVSNDAYGMTAELSAQIATNMKVDMTGVPNTTASNALVAIGGRNITKGIVAFTPAVNTSVGYMATTKLYMQAGSNVKETPVRNFLLKVKNTYDIRVQVPGYSQDVLTGKAICRSAAIVATQGNLMTGSFTWEGTGPLA